MTASVYRQTKTQNAAGQVVRSYSKLDTIDCYAKPTRSISADEQFGATYTYTNQVKLKTSFPLILGDRIANIKDANGKVLWTESDGDTMVFDVDGIAPLANPLGIFTEYEVFLERAEVQETYA